MKDIPANERLIVALDYNTTSEAVRMVHELGDDITFYKVGWQLFMETHFDVIEYLIAEGKQVFLDLKMTDIPATIQKAIINMPMHGIKFMTLFGSNNVVSAAKEGCQIGSIKFLKVPALSSDGGSNIDTSIVRDCIGAIDAGADGAIVSGTAIRTVRSQVGDTPYIVSPGIRPLGVDTDDHKRHLTPQKAIEYGADYLVVGRPITQADNPKQTALDIIEDIKKALI